MSKLTLYGTNLSPSVRAVLLTLKALNLPFEFVEVKILKQEHYEPKYLEKNPQHTVPILEDDGQCICDSHAINAYLVDKYASSDDLYPKDPEKRGLVIEQMQFESGVIFSVFRRISRMIFVGNKKILPKEKLKTIYEAYRLVNELLTDKQFIAGESLSIADFSLVATMTSLNALFGVYEPQYPFLFAWLQRMSNLPYYKDGNGDGIKKLTLVIQKRRIVFDQGSF